MDLTYIKEDHDTPFLVSMGRSSSGRCVAHMIFSGAPRIQVVHRADLQQSIMRACNQFSQSITFKLAHTVIEVAYAPAGQCSRFLVRRDAATGNEGEKEQVWLEADVLVGADGIRSVARRDMLRLRGDEDHGQHHVSRSRSLLRPGPFSSCRYRPSCLPHSSHPRSDATRSRAGGPAGWQDDAPMDR